MAGKYHGVGRDENKRSLVDLAFQLSPGADRDVLAAMPEQGLKNIILRGGLKVEGQGAAAGTDTSQVVKGERQVG